MGLPLVGLSSLRSSVRTSDRAIETNTPDDKIVTTATRFEEVTVENQSNRNSKLDGPPSPFMTSCTVETLQASAKRYVLDALPTEMNKRNATSR
jgi:hypothetical protein